MSNLRRSADIACRTTAGLSPSVTERVHLPQNAAVDFRGQLIEALSTARGRLYAEQVTRSATPGVRAEGVGHPCTLLRKLTGILKTGHPDGRFHLGCDSLTTVKDPGGWRAEVAASGDDRA